MAETKVSKRYARSLHTLALEQGLADAVYGDMILLRDTCEGNRELSQILRNPIIQADSKDKLVRALFEKQFQAVSTAFCSIVVRKGREGYLPQIAESYISTYKEHKGIHSAQVTSALPLDEQSRKQVFEILHQFKGPNIELKEVVDPSIIGGIILQVGDQQLDLSVETKLQQLQNQFRYNIYERQF